MTTPEPELTVPWAVFRPGAIGASTLTIRAHSGVRTVQGYQVRLPQGINTIMVTWAGYGGLHIQLRERDEFLYRTTPLPSAHGTGGERMVVIEAPVEDPDGHLLVITGFSMLQEDLDSKARAGVKIIPSNM